MYLYVTRRGILLPRVLFVVIAAVVAAVLTISMLPSEAVAQESGTSEANTDDELEADASADDSDGDGDLDRPDGISAGITARLVKKRVEDLSKRTESTRTFVNPDGTLTDERFGGDVRMQAPDGTWEDIDYNLTQDDDGSWKPKAAPVDVTIDGGSSKEAARVTFDDGESLAVTWPENLPEPTVDGGVATYELSDATDLIIAVTGSGVTARIRLNEPPLEDDPVFNLGLRADGLDVSKSGEGLRFADSDGERLGGTSDLVAWDARTDDGGAPVDIVPLDSTLDEISQAGDVVQHDLELKTPEGFLTDPSTQYPVTIDPDISGLARIRDTWVRQGDSTYRGSSHYLEVGKINGSSNTNPAISYLKFSGVTLANKDVISAELGLHQIYAYTCADRRMDVHPVANPWPLDIDYTNRPGVYTSSGDATYVNENRGATGCASGITTVNVTNIVDAWAKDDYANEGIRLTANDPDNSSYERRFCSFDPDTSTMCDTATERPYLNVTYNRIPNSPTLSGISPSTSDGAARFTTAAKPKVSLVLSDPDVQNVRAQIEVKNGSTTVFDGYTAYVSSGGTVTKELPTLADGAYTMRFRAYDDRLHSTWTSSTTMTVDTTAPGVPVVACTGATSGTWYETRPASSSTCTVSGGAGVTGFEWTRGNKPQPTVTADGSGNATLDTFSVPANGVFGVSVRSRDAAGNLSAPGEFGFGTGDAGMITPVNGERTSSTVLVEAEAPTDVVVARIEHRPTGDDTADWTTASKVKPQDSFVSWLGQIITTDHGSDSTGKLVWDIAAEDGITAPAVREARVCFVYPGVTRCTPSRNVTVVPNAFGSSFPTQEAGPGQVALFTGEFQVSESDVEVPANAGTLSLGRSHRSYAGDTSPAAGVFGPGWVADLEGPDAGAGSAEVVDNTASEASITLLDAEGGSSTYIHEDEIASAQGDGYYVGDAETETDSDVLEITSSGGSKYLTLIEGDDTETTWKHLGSGRWVIEKIVEPGDTGSTTYTHDAAGLVTGIYAPAPSGVTCNGTTQTAGCRALRLTYSSTTPKRLDKVDLRIWDPVPGADGKPTSAATMDTITVQKYAYDDGSLVEAWDPRVGDGGAALKTTYEYASVGSKTVLTKATPPGQTPWRFEYNPSGPEAGRFLTAKRAQPAPLSGDATWTAVYDTALSGGALPDLQAGTTATWGQGAAPVGAATVYAPDAPGTSDTTYGTISYFDVEGRTTNTAVYGAGAWQIDSTVYDANGNVVWALDEGNRNTALTSGGDSRAIANSLASLTVYNDAAPGIPAGTRVEQAWGPTRQVILKNGDSIEGRSLETTVFDDEASAESVPVPGRPTAESDEPALNVPVEERSATVDAAGNVYDIRKTRYRYDPVVPGDGDGWELSSPTRTTVGVGTSAESTTMARFDTEGQTIETRTPQGVAAVNGTANDARSTKTVYYTADTSASDAGCREKPQWAGLECVTATGDDTVPKTRLTGYDYLLNVTRAEESATVAGATMTRVLVTGYDAAGQKVIEKTAVANGPTDDVAVPDVTYTYSGTTGALTKIAASTGTQEAAYDAWGRLLTQSDGAGNTATTTYDTAGRIKTFDDGKGTYTLSYNGTDAAGKSERRGLVTKVNVGLASGPDEFTIASNADGNSYLTKYPNGIEAATSFDASGVKTALTYVDSSDVEIAAFSNSLDAQSRVRAAESSGSAQAYTYDDRDRLIKVEDTTAAGCTTRRYTFSLDSNRETLATSGPDSAGGCSTAGASTVASGFDAADRITATGYTYDGLGRTRTVPAAHTDQPDGGALGVAYHGNDMVAKLSQTVPNGDGSTEAKTKSFTLDATSRLSKTADTSAGLEVRKTVNHYADSGDAPAWISTETRPNASTAWVDTWSRNVLGPDGDLAIIQGSVGTPQVQIANLHGDVVTTLDNTIGPVTGMGAWVETTEYGLARDDTKLGQNYGWLGAKRRSTDSLGGLTLMGVRLYNPATGRFLSMDSVPGGNDNTFVYPPDPINFSDLDGRKKQLTVWVGKRWYAKKSGWKKVSKNVRVSYWLVKAVLIGAGLLKKIPAVSAAASIAHVSDFKQQTQLSYSRYKRWNGKKWVYGTALRGWRWRYRATVTFAGYGIAKKKKTGWSYWWLNLSLW